MNTSKQKIVNVVQEHPPSPYDTLIFNYKKRVSVTDSTDMCMLVAVYNEISLTNDVRIEWGVGLVRRK